MLSSPLAKAAKKLHTSLRTLQRKARKEGDVMGIGRSREQGHYRVRDKNKFKQWLEAMVWADTPEGKDADEWLTISSQVRQAVAKLEKRGVWRYGHGRLPTSAVAKELKIPRSTFFAKGYAECVKQHCKYDHPAGVGINPSYIPSSREAPEKFTVGSEAYETKRGEQLRQVATAADIDEKTKLAFAENLEFERDKKLFLQLLKARKKP
jgi:hypothetical protein